MLRRLGLICSALLALNLSAAETLRACASQAEHAAPAAVDHSQHHGAPQQAPAEEDCEQPELARCCNALSSCGLTISIDGAADVASVIPARQAVTAPADNAPSALDRTPEPPPPKA